MSNDAPDFKAKMHAEPDNNDDAQGHLGAAEMAPDFRAADNAPDFHAKDNAPANADDAEGHFYARDNAPSATPDDAPGTRI